MLKKEGSWWNCLSNVALPCLNNIQDMRLCSLNETQHEQVFLDETHTNIEADAAVSQ